MKIEKIGAKSDCLRLMAYSKELKMLITCKNQQNKKSLNKFEKQ